MSSSRRRLILLACAVVAYAVVLTGVWAARPLHDSIPVGMDWSPTVQTPPKGQRLVSQEVECNTLFANQARPDDALATLTAQPEGYSALEFQREPCTLVHSNARILFAVNVVAVAGLLALIALVAARSRRLEA